MNTIRWPISPSASGVINPLSLIPGVSFAKLLAVIAVGGIVFGLYRMVDNYIDEANETRTALAQVQEAYQAEQLKTVQLRADITRRDELARIEAEFQAEKVRLVEQYQAERQGRLDRQEAQIASMGTAERLAEVSALDNGISTGSERLTYRAQQRTSEISQRIMDASRHGGLYE